MRGRSLAVCIVAAGVLLGGCGEDVAAPDEEDDVVELTPDPDRPEPLPPADEPDLEAQVEQAQADLTERTGVDADDIAVVRAEAVVWSDGSIGCPEPGMMYTQALVEGALIELEADGEIYRYHSGADEEPFLCDDPEEPVERRGGVEQ